MSPNILIDENSAWDWNSSEISIFEWSLRRSSICHTTSWVCDLGGSKETIRASQSSIWS